MNIPEEAVIAAAKVLIREQSNGYYGYHPEGHPRRDDLDRYAESHARAALEAAVLFLPCCKGCPDCKGIL